jgi:hypothetical protein
VPGLPVAAPDEAGSTLAPLVASLREAQQQREFGKQLFNQRVLVFNEALAEGADAGPGGPVRIPRRRLFLISGYAWMVGITRGGGRLPRARGPVGWREAISHPLNPSDATEQMKYWSIGFLLATFQGAALACDTTDTIGGRSVRAPTLASKIEISRRGDSVVVRVNEREYVVNRSNGVEGMTIFDDRGARIASFPRLAASPAKTRSGNGSSGFPRPVEGAATTGWIAASRQFCRPGQLGL